MKREVKRGVYRSNLEVVKDSRDAFATFTEPESSKFIQAISTEDPEKVSLDIPSKEMNPNQPSSEELNAHFPGLSETSSPFGSSYGKDCDPVEAIDVIDSFFIELCGLDPGHELDLNTNTEGEESCFVCGAGVSPGESNFKIVDTEDARELGVQEERIQDEIDTTIELHKQELTVRGDYTDKELTEDANEFFDQFPLVMVPLCGSCSVHGV